MTGLDKVYVFGMLSLLLLFTIFLIVRYEKITISENKLRENYIKIYETKKEVFYTEYIKIKFKTKGDYECDLSEALNKNLTSIEKIIKQSSRKEEKENVTIYYFDKKSKIKTNKNFQIIVCKKEKKDQIYLIGEYKDVCEN